MKKFFLFTILILSIIVPVSALYNCSYIPINTYSYTGSPIIFSANTSDIGYLGYLSSAQATSLCNACGYTNTINDVSFGAISVTESNVVYRNDANSLGPFSISATQSLNSRYVYRQLNCDNSHFVRISNGACLGPGNIGLPTDIWYKQPMNTDECIVGTAPAIETNFTVLPSTGGSPLSVLFTISQPSAINSSGALWVWGDGTSVSNSISTTISHTYVAQKLYSPIMYYYNGTGVSKSYTALNAINVTGIAPPIPVTSPTPGVVPTNLPSEITNATYTFIDYSTDEPLENVYTESWFNNDQSSIQGYTDVYGRIEFGFAEVEKTTIRAWKPGYQTIEEVHYPTPMTYNAIIYMYPSVSSEDSIPDKINVTLTIRNANGGAAIQSAYVTLKDDISGTGEISTTTNAAGVAKFTQVPNTAYISGDITRSGFYSRTWSLPGILLNDYEDTLYLESTSGQPGPSPTVTPTTTPALFDNVILSVSPTAIELGGSATLSASATSESLWQKAALIFYYVTPPSGGEISIGQFKKNSTSGKYDFRVASSGSFIPGTTDGRTLLVNPNAAGNHKYRLYVSNVTAGNTATGIGYANANLMVGGAGAYGSLTMTLYAGDGATNSHLNNYNLNLTEDATGYFEDLGSVVYDVKKSLSRGSSYTLRGSKSGYIDGAYTFTVPVDETCGETSFCAYAGVSLYPLGSVSAGNTSITISITDVETYLPLRNVLVQEADESTSYSVTEKYTGAEGEDVLFQVPYNTEYAITAIKEGYCTVSETGNTGTDQYKYVSLYMKYGGCTGPQTPTPTPTPYTSITPTPVPTLIGGWGNVTVREPYVCNADLKDPTMTDLALNAIACNGISDAQGQGIAISVIVIGLLALILGKVAGGIGILGGAILGTLVCILMGFLPLWIIIVLIIIAGLIFASKLFAGSGD
jgi:hypothetical protein